MDIEWQESILFKSKASDIIDKIRLMSFTVTEGKKENKFRLRSLEKSLPIVKLGLIVAIIVYLLLFVIEIIFVSMHPQEVKSFNLWLSLSLLIVYTILVLFLKTYNKNQLYGFVLHFAYLYPIPFTLLSDYYDYKSSIELTSIKLCFQILLLTQCSTLLFQHQSLPSLLVCIAWIIYTVYKPSASNIVAFLFIIITLCCIYNKESKLRVYSNLKSTGEKELKKIENL